MTAEELLKVRYKAIAGWPGNTKYEIGDILKGYSPGCGGGNLIVNDKGESIWLSPENFPTLFKKLEWWEDRKESDMPEFLKYATKEHSAKHFVVYPVKFIRERYGWTCVVERTIIPHGNYLKDKLPATKEEYEQSLDVSDVT